MIHPLVGRIVALNYRDGGTCDEPVPRWGVVLDVSDGLMRVGSLGHDLPARVDDERLIRWWLPLACLGPIECVRANGISPEVRAEADRLVELAYDEATTHPVPMRHGEHVPSDFFGS
jgi:hypothetical protein